MRSILFALLLSPFALAASAAQVPSNLGPSAQEVVEFEQIIQPLNQSDDLLKEQVSPDGTRAFIVTRKANVPRDTNRYEIKLLDLIPTHLATQGKPHPVTIYSAEVRDDNNYAAPGVQDVRWHDDRTLVFMARLDGQPMQVYRFDVLKREQLQLTHENNWIVSFAVSRDLQRLVYAVQAPNPPLRDGRHDVVVGAQSFFSVKFGQNNLRAQDRRYQYFVADIASSQPPRPLGAAFPQGNGTHPTVDISPDGRWALLPRYEPERMAARARQYPLFNEYYQDYGRHDLADPQHYFSTPQSFVGRRLTAWRLDDGHEQTVVDAPDDARGDTATRGDRLWQGNGESVVVSGTFLPLMKDGGSSSESHVIEYWPDTGQWKVVTRLEDRLKEAHPIRDGFVVIDGTHRREFQRQASGEWRESNEHVREQAGDSTWTLHIAQSLNQPPDVFATTPSGPSTRLTLLNPQFDASWGTMRPFSWRDASGRQWDGGLMSGSGSAPPSPRPLLIQTYGFSPDRFYLDGPNTSDGFSSAFAGRAFLRSGILVLAMPWSPKGGSPSPEHEAFLAFYAGVRGAVDALVREGRVDPAKIGIMGWSATGERVLNLLEFGDTRIRAATMADGDSNTLSTFALAYGSWNTIWERLESVNGGLPVGNTLAAWVRNDPALHTDCIHAAVRIESYGPVVLPNWDLYALLRRQYKAAEMIMLPGGSHSLLTPGDRLASLQGNVDWHAFWLAGETRAVPVLPSETEASLAGQYARWRQMETMKAVDDARTNCVH